MPLKDERDGLDGLAEAHVVRETGAESPLREEGKPGHAAQLVVAERSLQALRLRQHLELLLAAELVEQAAQPAMRLHLVDAEAPNTTGPQRERNGLGDAELLSLCRLDCTQCLPQHKAVHLDPPIAEEHQRCPLVEQELQLALRHLLAVHADRQFRADGLANRCISLCRRPPRRELGLDGQMLARHAVRHFDGEPGGSQGLGSCTQKIVRIGAGQLSRSSPQ